jgi:hypothetical protein
MSILGKDVAGLMRGCFIDSPVTADCPRRIKSHFARCRPRLALAIGFKFLPGHSERRPPFLENFGSRVRLLDYFLEKRTIDLRFDFY